MFSNPNNHNSQKGMIRVFGRNPDVDTSGGSEDIWDGGNLYTFPNDSGEGMYISSSNGSDNQTVRIYALDANFVLHDFEVTLNGQTKTQINNGTLYSRILKAYNSGSSALSGDIYIYTNDTVTNGVPDTASKIKGKINSGYEQTLSSIFTIPKGLNAEIVYYLMSISKISDASNSADMVIKAREFGGTFRTIMAVGCGDEFFKDTPKAPIMLSEKTDILIRCTSIKNSNNAINACVDLILY